MTLAGSVSRAGANPSGVDDAGAAATDTATACEGDGGWLLTSVASIARRTSRPGRNRSFINAGEQETASLPNLRARLHAAPAAAGRHRSEGRRGRGSPREAGGPESPPSDAAHVSGRGPRTGC